MSDQIHVLFPAAPGDTGMDPAVACYSELIPAVISDEVLAMEAVIVAPELSITALFILPVAVRIEVPIVIRIEVLIVTRRPHRAPPRVVAVEVILPDYLSSKVVAMEVVVNDDLSAEVITMDVIIPDEVSAEVVTVKVPPPPPPSRSSSSG
jgi:hypothetical protein